MNEEQNAQAVQFAMLTVKNAVGRVLRWGEELEELERSTENPPGSAGYVIAFGHRFVDFNNDMVALTQATNQVFTMEPFCHLVDRIEDDANERQVN